MINIVINNNNYNSPSGWEEVTINQAIQLQKVVENAPAQIKEYFVSQFEPSAHEPSIDATNSHQLLDLLTNTLNILCGIELEELSQVDPKQIEHFATKYLSVFIVSMIFDPVFTPKGIKQFEWQGQTLMLPDVNIDVEGLPLPFANISAEQLCQATDLHIAGSIRYASIIVALLCRNNNEEFSIKKSLECSQSMGEMPMSIVFEVFFCFRKLMNI